MAKKRESVGGTSGEETGEYEKLREKRVKENAERMQELGLFDLSSKLKLAQSRRNAPSSAGKRTRSSPHLSNPIRRSLRLNKLPPAFEIEPELYTEEHEKLLGDCKVPWNPSVNGRGFNDQVEFKSCHHCSHSFGKTRGHHTHCSKCKLARGHLCGDCLYKRYGENVIEANQNPDWICPVCRGICNCSICRRAKGWNKLGAAYPKAVSLGFKSVAHYLILTRRAHSDLQ